MSLPRFPARAVSLSCYRLILLPAVFFCFQKGAQRRRWKNEFVQLRLDLSLQYQKMIGLPYWGQTSERCCKKEGFFRYGCHSEEYRENLYHQADTHTQCQYRLPRQHSMKA